MTKQTDKLNKEIQQAKDKKAASKKVTIQKASSGYGIAMEMLTDLIGCVIVGFALGVFFQKVFDTSILFTVTLTFLGTVAGLWTIVRTGIRLSKRGI